MILRNFFEKNMKYFCNKLNYFVTIGIFPTAYFVSLGASDYKNKKRDSQEPLLRWKNVFISSPHSSARMPELTCVFG